MGEFPVMITVNAAGNEEQMRLFKKQLEQFMRQRGFTCANQTEENGRTNYCFDHYKFTTTLHKTR